MVIRTEGTTWWLSFSAYSKGTQVSAQAWYDAGAAMI